MALKVFRVQVERSGTNTGGLVQEFDHLVLPSIKPITTFTLTFLAILPCVCKLSIDKFDKYVNDLCTSFPCNSVNNFLFF